MKTISILGCGWLGIPLAETLIDKGFLVKGSTTSQAKIKPLETKGIQMFQVSLEADAVEGDIDNFLKGSEVLIIDIPPRFHFSQKIATLVPFIQSSGIQKVLLVNSISIYADSDTVITEDQIPNPKTDKSHQLFAAENTLQNQTGFQTTVLRFAGLVDEKRHPVKYLAGEQNLENPDAPVNLIHKQDCIGIILKIIETGTWGEVFNAAAPFHPTREKYYTQKAQQFHLAAPQFDHSKKSSGKTIDSSKLQRMLHYEFQFREL
ncbi:NAD(P)H-binding protein [Flavobacterium sp.]|uniref:NAD(P)H-binding protein n=1 Tax=Flavobacterium sp. TaxID=239 RepID=UPI0039E370C1